MSYLYDKCKYSDSTVNTVSVTYTNSLCTCGSNEFIVINANQTSSVMNSKLKCIKCGKDWMLYYD